MVTNRLVVNVVHVAKHTVAVRAVQAAIVAVLDANVETG